MANNAILARYDIGKVQSFIQIPHDNTDHNVYKIKTNRGYFLLKEYKDKDSNVAQSIEVVRYLERRGYPCVHILCTKDGHYFIETKQNIYVLFEYIPLRTNTKPNIEMLFELGQKLALLHKLTKNFPMKNKPAQDLDYFIESFKANKNKLNNAPKRIKQIYSYIEDQLPQLKVPRNLPKSVCHEEFTLEHVFFRNSKIVKIIDWDLVARDYMFYDLAVTLCSGISDRVNSPAISNIIKGYNSKRKLTRWETKHIFKAIQFGAFKFAIWNLEEVTQWKWHIDYARIEAIMQYTEESFKQIIGP